MNDVSVEIIRSIDQVPASEWDALCGGRSFINHRWLRLAESIVIDSDPRYILVRKGGQLQAAAVCSLARRFRHRALEQRLGWVLRLFPLMRCGVPIASQPGLIVRTTDVLPRLLVEVRGLARRERAAVVTCGQFSSNDETWLDLRNAGFQKHGQLVDFSVATGWSSIDEYLRSLPGGDRRKVSKLQRRAEREEIRIEHLESPLERAQQLRALVGGVLEHHGTSDIYARDLIERAAAVCGSDLHVLAAWRSSEMIGCAVVVRDGDALIAKWLGFDYARSWGTSTYRLLIFATLKLAIQLGVQRLALGPTAGDTKRDFGAVGEDRFSAVAVLAPVPASLVGFVAQLVAGRAAIDPTYSSAREEALPGLPG